MSIVQVAETSDFSGLVEVVKSDFHSSHDVEFTVVTEELLSVGGGLLGEEVLVEQEGVAAGL